MTLAVLSRSKRVASAPTHLARGNGRGAARMFLSRPGFVGSAPRLGAMISPQPPGLQTKLKVGEPNDKFEQEADRVADQVTRMPASENGLASVSEGGPRRIVRRMCDECAAEEMESLQRMPLPETGARPRISALNDFSMVSAFPNQTALIQRQDDEEDTVLQTKSAARSAADVPPRVQDEMHALRGGGQPLSSAERAFFEPRFGYDFGQVRIHTDVRSAELARAMKARAFTIGRDVVFGQGQFALTTPGGKELVAHELTHVVQQGSAVPQPMQSDRSRPAAALQRTSEPATSQVADVIQRAGDPAAIPVGLRCPTDLTAGRPAGADVLFSAGGSSITPAHTRQLTAFRATWLAAGGTDDILVHGYASTEGDQASNWTLSCDRAEAVEAELVRLGIPAVRISVVAHGESTDFGSSRAPNRHAVVSTRAAGLLPLPLVGGVLTPRDNFTGRSTTRFGVGEVVDLSFFSLPPRPAADFGGLEWHLVSGGGALTGVTNVGTATYTAPATAGPVRLELRVATGATGGRVISSHAITIVIPSGVNMVAVPGSAPSFGGWGAPAIPAGTWGAGFRANVFVDPKDVSFQGVVFGEGIATVVVTPPGSFLSPFAGIVHPLNTFGPGHGGNATTGTPVSPPPDGISTHGGVTPTTMLGVPICGSSDLLLPIPWEFSVAGGARTRFATANHHATSTLLCDATTDKAGAGPFCRRINGATC